MPWPPGARAWRAWSRPPFVEREFRDDAADSRAGSTTTATRSWFFAAARSIAGPADVDVLDRLGIGRRWRAALTVCSKGIEVDHHEVNRRDAVLGHDRIVDCRAWASSAAVDLRMQRLHAAVHDLGEAGVVRNVADGDAVRREEPRRAAGGENLDFAARESLGEFDESGLVGDRQECAADGDVHLARKAELPQLLA
jgi:hypothetical protein